MRTLTKCCGLALLLCTSTVSYADGLKGKDCTGCGDSGLPARYPGSILLGADQRSIEEVVLPAGPSVMAGGKSSVPKTLSVTGKLTRVLYSGPAERSGLEVFTNYRQTLAKSGMSVVWTCSGDQECGPEFLDRTRKLMHVELANTQVTRDGLKLARHARYSLARLARPQGDLHIAVIAADNWDKHRPEVFVIQIESKPMDKGMAATSQGKPVVEINPGATQSNPVKAEIKPAVVQSKPAKIEIEPATVETKPAANDLPAGTIQKGTLTNPQLMHDTMVGVAAKVAALGCDKPENFVAYLTARSSGTPGARRWREKWLVKGCGKQYPVDIDFSEDGARAANYTIENH